MNNVTGEQVKEAMVAAGIMRVPVRNCSICGYELAYVRDGDQLAYDAGCDCGAGHNLEPRSWDSAANLINMQSQQKWRDKFRADFGLPPSSEDVRR